MSKVLKSVGKIFKKVASNPKTLVFGALAAGAIVFTAGAALGVPVLAGGWAGAAGGMASSLGLTGTSASILTGAITQAGYGAAIGGAGAALTGRDIGDGMMVGAATGAVTGAATGAMSAPAGAAPQPGAPQASGPPTQLGSKLPTPLDNGAAGMRGLAGDAGADTLSGGADVGPPTGLAGGTGAAPTQTIIQAPQQGFLERNQGLVAGVVSGLGQGLASKSASEEAAQAALERDREEAERVSGNYRVGEGGIPNYRSASESPGRAMGFQWEYDPKKGKIVRVPRAS